MFPIYFISFIRICICLQLQEFQMDKLSTDWLITARSFLDYKYINSILNSTSIRFDQTIIVSYPHGIDKTGANVCSENFRYNKKYEAEKRFDKIPYNRRFYSECQNSKSEFERSYYKSTLRFKNLIRNKSYNRDSSPMPLNKSGLKFNFSRNFDMINISQFSLKRHFQEWKEINNYRTNVTGNVLVIQYFKVRLNSTLYVSFLGKFR